MGRGGNPVAHAPGFYGRGNPIAHAPGFCVHRSPRRKPGDFVRGGVAGPLHLDPLLARALEKYPLLQARQFGEWHVDRQTRRRAESFEHRPAQHAAIGTVEARPEVEGPRAERERGIANQ